MSPGANKAPVGNASGLAANAPSITLPLRFALAGVLTLLIGMVLLVTRPDVLSTYHYNQYVIAITHVFVLGWILTMVMGAVYQLVPVALETKLYSEKLAALQFLLHVAGFAGMVWMFWHWNMKQVGHFGSLLAAGVLLFVYNIARTLARVPRWNVVATSVAAALFWLLATIAAGLLVTAGKCSYDVEGASSASGFYGGVLSTLRAAGGLMTRFDAIATMHGHAHLGVVGVFVMLIVGVSYRLIPMFCLSEIQHVRRAEWSVYLLNAGLLGAFVTILLKSAWKPIFAAVILAGVVLYALEMIAMLRARKRRSIDWGVRGFLTALALLIPVGLIGFVLSLPLPTTAFMGQLENVYGFVGIAGVVSFAIVGMLYKIVPFLVWYAAYSKSIGLMKVPALADLYSHRLQMAGYWSYLCGLGLVTAGILAQSAATGRVGAVVLLASVVILVVNCALMLSHLIRPKMHGLRSPKAKSTTTISITAQAGNPV